jgi:DnaJ-class molecular chaperone
MTTSRGNLTLSDIQRRLNIGTAQAMRVQAALSAQDAVCQNCGGMGATTHDILVGGTEHDTEERECIECEGTGAVLESLPSAPSIACGAKSSDGRRCKKALGHGGLHWTYGRDTLSWAGQ